MRGGLKGFAEAKRTSVDLLKDVRTHVVAQGVKNSGAGRESHKIHVSELVKDTACPRHMYYKLSHEEPTDPAAPAYHRLEMIWAAGHDAHHKWQRWLKEMGDLWGSWTCLQCEHQWDALAPEACEKCGGVLLRYDEVGLEDPVYPLVGHADGAVPRLNSLIEIKSFSTGSVRMDNPSLVGQHTHKVDGRSIIDHEGLWKAVHRPLKSHLVQGLMYLWLCKRMGLSYEKIVFIYENKTTQDTKTFEVKSTERHIKVFFDILDEVMEAVEEGIPPRRPPLFTKESKPCKDCPFRTKCWEEDDQDGTQSAPVSTRRSRSRSEAASRTAEVRTSGEAEEPDSGGAGRHQRTRRPSPGWAHDTADSVGRAPGGATGDGRGGRAVGGRGDGEGPRSGFARRRG